MAEAVKNTEHGKASIRFELGTELADYPAALSEAVAWSLFKIGGRNQHIGSIETVKVKLPLNQKNRAIADILFNVTVMPEGVEQDYTALKQELAARISEALKSSKGGK